MVINKNLEHVGYKKVNNKDTVKAINAASTLIKYCARYKNCDKCVFYYKGCVINKPCDYKMIFAED